MNQWTKQPGTRLDMGAPRAMSVSRAGVAPAVPPPIIAQVAGINDRLARHDALLEAVLVRMTTSTATSPAAGALLAPANFIANAQAGVTTTLAQITAPVPITPAPAPLVLGGSQPAGYVYVGSNQGLTVWGHSEIVAASIMDDGEAGNV